MMEVGAGSQEVVVEAALAVLVVVVLGAEEPVEVGNQIIFLKFSIPDPFLQYIFSTFQ